MLSMLLMVHGYCRFTLGAEVRVQAGAVLRERFACVGYFLPCAGRVPLCGATAGAPSCCFLHRSLSRQFWQIIPPIFLLKFKV